MAIQGTVPVGGSFAPTDSADSFGTHNDKWGVGGYRIVKTVATRDNIPVNESGLLNLDDDLASGRRKLGMMVYVSDENKFYVLTIAQATWDGYNEGQKVTALADDTNWVEFSGGGGGDTGNIGFENNWIKNTVGEEIYISPQDGYSWLFLPSNTQTSAGNYVNLVNSDPDSGGVYITTSIGSWQFTPSGTTLFPSNALDAGTNSIDIKSSNYAELWFHGEDTVWQANTLSNEDAYVWVDFEGTHIQNYRGADGNGGPEWSYQWQFKNDGILQVPGRISFGSIDYQSIGVGNVSDHGGAYGISLYCTVGYELNWQAGYLAARDPYSPYDLRPIYSDSLIKYATPGDYPTFHATFDDDTLITKAYLDEQAYLTDAPSDGSTYGRKDGAWEVTTGGIPHATASGTDTYTVSITGVTAYNDGDAYLIRFTNGNTTSSTLNINSLGAKSLYRNNDGPLIGGDIFNGGEMICVYNSGTDGFQCIGSSPNSLFAYITNGETSTISRGQVVYAFSGTGDRMVVKLASNSGDATSAKTVGVVYSTSIGANQKGIILMQGLMDGLSILPTSTWADGDSVYLGSTAGSITKTKPYAPNHLVYVATVTTASNGNAGRMYVKIQNGYELDEIHDIDLITSPPTTGHYLYYNGTLWTNSSSWQGDTIAVTKGGTGFSSYTIGDILYADTTTSLAKLAGVAVGSVLVSGGVGAAPSWSNSPELRSIVLNNATNANTITLQTGDTAANYSLTLPTAAPAAGQYLQFSAAGVATWVAGTVNGVTTMAAIGAVPNANGASIASSTLTLQPASASFGGVVTTGTQSFAGAKTFSSAVTVSAASNQLAVGSGVNLLTINGGTSAAARTYTVPDAGTTSNFVMTTNTQNITATKNILASDSTVATYLGFYNGSQDPTGNVTHVNGVTTGTTYPSGARLIFRSYTTGYASYIGRSTDLSSMLFACNTGGRFEFWTAFTENIRFNGASIQINTAGTLQQVIGARRTGWTAATGTAQRTTFATDTVTLINLARAVKALIDDLISHGLIGT